MQMTDPYNPTRAQCREYRKRVTKQKLITPLDQDDGNTNQPATASADTKPTDKTSAQAPANQQTTEQSAPARSSGIGRAILILTVVVLAILLNSGSGDEPLRLIALPEPYAATMTWTAGGLLTLGSLLLIAAFVWIACQNDRHLLGPLRFNWDEQGFHQHSRYTTTHWPWHAITRWYESDRLIVIATDQFPGPMIPKAAITPQQADELTARLRAALGEPSGDLADAS
ncbi:MAG: YcxB family protein [Planctomycetota bacterium]